MNETINEEAKGITGILGNPEGFIRRLCADKSLAREGALLVLLAAGGAALFGFGMGCFVDWKVALLDAGKSAGIVLFSYLICLPTLYVFSSLSGCRTSFARLALVGLVPLAGLGCILAALAPVLWLFAVSTESLGFFVHLAFVMVFVGVCLAVRVLGSIRKAGVVVHQQGVSAWFAVFLVVALQAITLVRPMLSPIGAERSPSGKCFFLSHFGKCALGE